MQTYTVQTAENGYVVTFQCESGRSTETHVFVKFTDLLDFMVTRLRWAAREGERLHVEDPV